MLAHVVVIRGLLDELAGGDARLDRRDGCVRPGEQRRAVDARDDSSAELDVGVGADHLQVENVPA